VSTWREQGLHAKAVRRGAVVEPRPVGGRSRRPKPVVVEARWSIKALGQMGREWRRFGIYRDLATAEKAIADHKRKHGFYEFRYREH